MYLFKWPVIIHSLFSISLAVLVNVTVDDTFGDPETGRIITYNPADQWNDGYTCGSCSTNNYLNRTMIFEGTLHKSVANKSSAVETATISFIGSAVYVYCIIPEEHMDITFLIDFHLAGNFSKGVTRYGTFQYNALVYFNQSLPQGNHTLTIQNGHRSGSQSFVILDYIVYSYDDGLDAPPESPIQPVSTSKLLAMSAGNAQSPEVNSAGKIVGGVLGSIGGMLLVLVAFLWHRQRTRKGSNDLSRPPTLLPKYRTINPVTRIQSWWRNPGNGSRSRFSFNPSLLVEPMMMNQKHATAPNFRRPPPVTTVHPIYPLPQRPDSIHPLQPNREVTPTPSLDPRNEPSQPLSIIEWQRRTEREADDTPPRLDVSDVEMSSYYEFSSDTPDPPLPQPPPRSAPRRFTVVNN